MIAVWRLHDCHTHRHTYMTLRLLPWLSQDGAARPRPVAAPFLSTLWVVVVALTLAPTAQRNYRCTRLLGSCCWTTPPTPLSMARGPIARCDAHMYHAPGRVLRVRECATSPVLPSIGLMTTTTIPAQQRLTSIGLNTKHTVSHPSGILDLA